MKYKTFTNLVLNLARLSIKETPTKRDYETPARTTIYYNEYEKVAIISNEHELKFEFKDGFDSLPTETKRELFSIVYEYVTTPLDERTENLFFLRFAILDNQKNYLIADKESGTYYSGKKDSNVLDHACVFTKSFIDNVDWVNDYIEKGVLIPEPY